MTRIQRNQIYLKAAEIAFIESTDKSLFSLRNIMSLAWGILGNE